MKKVLLFALILVVFASCKCPKIVTDTQVVRDEIVRTKEVVVRDTVFITKPTKVFVEVPIEKITEVPVIKYRKNARVVLQKVRDTIRVTATCDSIALAAKIKDQLTTEKQVKEIVTTEIVRVRFIPWTVKALAIIGSGCLIVFGTKLIINKYF